MTDRRRTDQTTHQQMDMRGHRRVTLPRILNESLKLNAYLYSKEYLYNPLLDQEKVHQNIYQIETTLLIKMVSQTSLVPICQQIVLSLLRHAPTTPTLSSISTIEHFTNSVTSYPSTSVTTTEWLCKGLAENLVCEHVL